MDILALKKSSLVKIAIALFLCANVLNLALPFSVAYAQLSDGAPTAGQPGQAGQTQPGKVTDRCSGYGAVFDYNCWGRAMGIYGSAAIISVTGWALEIAGILFNAALELTIGTGQDTGFDAQIYSRIKGGVEAVWTAFRDIANIIIIGMFTFTAITLILGIQSFSAKTMVAKVLLIAILINFSLLFTRIIISSSNFVASQFYKAAQFGASPANASTDPASKYSTGISGKFAQLMGVASFADTKTALWKVAEKKDDGIIAIGLGLLTGIIFVAAALVFFYASILLIARALLFIMLLITSSLAFASYLVPSKILMGNDGWNMWWSSLLKNAVFGPILLLMLWATIIVGQGIKATNGSIGGLLSEPSTGGNINALFSYLMILGMLYASIKIATMFATKIGGFNWAAVAPAFGAGVLSRIGGFAGRQTVGRAGLRIGQSLQESAAARKERGQWFRSSLLDLGAQGFKTAGRRDFNLMRTQFGKEVQKVAGIKKTETLAGPNVKGFEGWEKARAEKFAEQAERMKLSDKDKEKMLAEAYQQGMDKRPDLKARHDDADTVIRDSAQAMQQMTQQQGKAAEEFTKATKQLQDAQRQAAAGAMNAHEVTRLEKEVKDKDDEIKDRNQKIRDAQRISNRAAQARESVRRELRELAGLPDQFMSTDDVAAELAHRRFSNILSRAFGGTIDDDNFAQLARKQVGEISKKKKRKDLIAELQEDLRPSAPPPSSSGPTTPPGVTP